MTALLWLHVAGGAVGLVAGLAALAAGKGARLHRAAGLVFVYAMLGMGLSGALIAAITGVETSVVMGVLAAYLVITGYTTVAPIRAAARPVGLSGAAVAIGLALALTDIAVRGLRAPEGAVEGLPAPMALLFAAVALCAAFADVRVSLASSPPRGGRRLARHLWRMCFALFIASASFFLGQIDVLPAQLRAPWLVAPPVLAPVVVMIWWLWRVRGGQRVARRALPTRVG